MANLPETAVWQDDIYQIGTTDPVEGGPPNLPLGRGLVNVPHQQLAARTLWLRAQVEALAEAIAALPEDAVTEASLAAMVATESAAVTGSGSGLMTAELVGLAIAAKDKQIGINQAWQDVADNREVDTWYQNTSGRPIFVVIRTGTSASALFDIGPDTATFVTTTHHNGGTAYWQRIYAIVPDGFFYRGRSFGSGIEEWKELR